MNIFLPLLILLLFFCWYFLNAEFCKGSLKTIRADYQESFVTEAQPIETFKAIMQYAIQNGYRIDDVDQQKLSLILNERMTLASYGSLYPIYVHESEGKTLVEVGATSKLGRVFRYNPINTYVVTDGLKNMVSNIKSVIIALDTSN